MKSFQEKGKCVVWQWRHRAHRRRSSAWLCQKMWHSAYIKPQFISAKIIPKTVWTLLCKVPWNNWHYLWIQCINTFYSIAKKSTNFKRNVCFFSDSCLSWTWFVIWFLELYCCHQQFEKCFHHLSCPNSCLEFYRGFLTYGLWIKRKMRKHYSLCQLQAL